MIFVEIVCGAIVIYFALAVLFVLFACVGYLHRKHELEQFAKEQAAKERARKLKGAQQ